MTEHDRPLPPLESLLRHRAWVCAVARRLLRDEQAAEDLAQEAWVRALRSPPDPDRDPKPWLRRVLKNLASNARRGAGRRARHEHAGGAHRERARRAARSPEALVAEAEQHRRLVGHVLDLEEPFKTVLVLRFYEGLTPPEIARRMDTAVGTVHSRLSRAIGRLKRRLDVEEGGSRRAWLAGLLPLADTRDLAPVAASGGTAAATAGVLMTLAKSKLAWLTLLLLGCLLGSALLIPSFPPDGDDADATAELRDAAAAEDEGPALETRGAARHAAAPDVGTADASTPGGASAPPREGQRWHGIVRDVEGRPVRNAEVFVLPREATGVSGPARGDPRLGGTRSDAQGRFVVTPGRIRHPRLVAWTDFHLPASVDLEGRDPAHAIELVLKPPRIVRVRVTREGHEGFLPLAVTVTTPGELSDRTHDPARQATWRQSAEAADDDDGDEFVLPMRLNTTAPLEITFDAPWGFTTIPRRHRIPAATGTRADEDTQRCAFRVVPSATLRYRLVDAETGAPLEGPRRTRFFLFAAGTRDVVASASVAEPRFEVTTGLPPGRYAYELHAAGYASAQGDVVVRRPGEAIAGTLHLVPAPPEVGGQLVLTLRHPAVVPDRVRHLARHDGSRQPLDMVAVFLRRHGETRWTDAVGFPDPGAPDAKRAVRVAPASLEAGRARFPEGSYDVVVARNGHGTAAFLPDVRIFQDQDTELDVPLEPGTFLSLQDIALPDLPLKALEVRALGHEAWGTLPFLRFRSGGHNAYTTEQDVATLLAVPRGRILLGPFPARELSVRIVPAQGAPRTVVVR